MSHNLGIKVTPVKSPRSAVEDTDILLVITSSQTPVFQGDWLSVGTHVAAAGGAGIYVREFDESTLRRCDILVTDDLANARIEAGEFIRPATTGDILWEQLRELWQVVGGVVLGRRCSSDITLFKSLGMALWDISAAKAIYDKAVTRGVGQRLPSNS